MSDLILHTPVGPPAQLLVLLHGVASEPQSLARLGPVLAKAFPQARIIALCAPHPSALGQGFEWFPLEGINDENRETRIHGALASFTPRIQALQIDTQVSPAATALIGFSQGAILALESTQIADGLAGRIVGIAGRFAHTPPKRTPANTTLHLIHGKADTVISYEHTVRAAESIINDGGDITADVLPHLDHRINDEVAQLIVERLTAYVPQRVWAAAMQAAP